MRNTAYSIPPSSSAQAGGAPTEQNGWQSYYNYAQQLYNAGYTQQAEQYHAYAQQLYNAETQQGQQASIQNVPQTTAASTAPKAAVPAQPAAQRPSVPAPPTSSAPKSNTMATAPTQPQSSSWKVLYEHAQQLHAEGKEAEAQKYWQQAQALYNHANSQTGADARTSVPPQSQYQTSNSGAAFSYPPAQRNSITPPAAGSAPISVSRDSRPSAPTMAQQALGNTSEMPSRNAVTAEIERPAFAAQPEKKKPTKRRIKIWVTAILLGLVFICIFGYLGLFHLYRQQQNDKTAGTYYYNSVFGKVQSFALQPMIDTLKPAFDKTIRLSVAAQPLLYELNLSDRLPERQFVRSAGRNAGMAVPRQRSTSDVVTETESIQTTPTSLSPVDNAIQSAAPISRSAIFLPAPPSEEDDEEDAATEDADEKSADASNQTLTPDDAQTAMAEQDSEKVTRSSKKTRKRRKARRTARKATREKRRNKNTARSKKSKKAKKSTTLSSDPLAGMGLDTL